MTARPDQFPIGSEVFIHISGGWPQVLSSLKSFLETGKGMMAPWHGEKAEVA